MKIRWTYYLLLIFVAPLVIILSGTVISSLGTKSDESQTSTRSIAIIETTKGTIEIELKPDSAPSTVSAFEANAKSGVYDGLSFSSILNTEIGINYNESDSLVDEAVSTTVSSPLPQGGTFEVSAASLGLSGQLVSDIPVLSNTISEDLLTPNANSDLQSFYETQFGLEYSDKLLSMMFSEDVVGMNNENGIQNGEFFLVRSGPRFDLDGRYTPFAKVISGSEIIDTLSGEDTILSVTIQEN